MNNLIYIVMLFSLAVIPLPDVFADIFNNQCCLNHYTNITDVPQNYWDMLATKKIFFGHHSVGKNILNGLNKLLKEHPNIKLKIVKAPSPDSKSFKAGLYEEGVGKNFHPLTKIEDFKEIITSGYGNKVDIAFFKFCFVDFNPKTNINSIFFKYKTTMEELQQSYPRTKFPVVTVPLTCYAPGLEGLKKRTKDIIKKLIKKTNDYDHSSANRFNEFLLTEFTGKTPIFDLARYESTRPDGSRVINHIGNQINYELDPQYTTDGGHLNEKGQKIIATRFLLFLAELANENK